LADTHARLKNARLTRKQKAVVITKFLIDYGADLPLSQLPDTIQAELFHQMSAMPTVNQSTLAEVISEFAHELDSVGLVFLDGLTRALSQLDGKIGPKTASKIRKKAGVRQVGDPWDTLRAMSLVQLEPILLAESSEVASVVLSKLGTSKAAALLGALPGDQARRIIYAISLSENVTPNAVDQIGLSLDTQTSNKPERAFDATRQTAWGNLERHHSRPSRYFVEWLRRRSNNWPQPSQCYLYL
jgi:flagellar motor switch protein FliG